MAPTATDDIILCDPFGRPNARLVLAAARAGALGVLDLASAVDKVGRRHSRADATAVAALIDRVAERAPRRWAVRLDPGASAPPLPESAGVVVLAAGRGVRPDDVAAWAGRTVLVEVTSLEQAEEALAAGASGLLAKGTEAGGLIGSTEGLILAQQVRRLGLPWWLASGVGPRTAAAATAAGACGVVLSDALALVEEVRPGLLTASALAAMDGTETQVVAEYQVWSRPGSLAGAMAGQADADDVRGRLGDDVARHLVPAGPDTALAAPFAARWRSVGAVVSGLRDLIRDNIRATHRSCPLAPGSGLAASIGLRFPVAQGPMTRVSDQAGFALAVADGGGLPFLALSMLSGEQTRQLLNEAATVLGSRPWGVGILGFVPPDVRAAQLAVVEQVRPPYAIIAGGRPSQARALEAVGTATFIHVPSPGLLRQFLDQGARRFVFEGRECGGHVGPRSSLALWEAQLSVLAERDDLRDIEVLLAGGVHDAVSAAMAGVALGPLADHGARCGVVMGSGYLFTREAVVSGAITAAYQREVVRASRTVLLETSPGHATRCLNTPYVHTFETRKSELAHAGTDPAAAWAELETLNLGRLRLAGKGRQRTADGLVAVDEATQVREGMFMVGQVATLRDAVTTVSELHEEVCAGSAALVEALAGELGGAAMAAAHTRERAPLDVAVIGMAGVFPQAADASEFWADVVEARDAIIEVPPQRWSAERHYDPDASAALAGQKTPSRWGGFIPRVAFDPLEFGIPPASLAAIEPVQLLALSVAARALADAGYRDRGFDRSRAAVVFGAEGGTDLQAALTFRSLAPDVLGRVPPELERYLPAYTEDSFPGVLTNVIAGRIANRLDLGGVNYTVDAACASSLAALDAACKELVAGGSDLVLCGGADLHNGINDYLLFSSVRALSPTGRSRPFAAGSDGIALGEAVACVVLKRLADAQRDGDRVYAVLDAVSGSSDGRHLGLTAPRPEGQRLALLRAYGRAGYGPEQIGLVEAHGTGTVVGDRTELATLTGVFSAAGVEAGSTVLGSVKSQVGHTKCAAGLVGLVKAARSVYHGVLPPTLHIEQPHADWDRSASPFRFLSAAQPWPDERRRAAISAFGFGGSNFHALISSAPDGELPPTGVERWPTELVVLRGATIEDARRRASELAALAERITENDPGGIRHRLRDAAHLVSSGAAWPAEATAPVQAAAVVDGWASLAAAMRAIAEGGSLPEGAFVRGESADKAGNQVAFLFPGQGSQRPRMLAELFVAFPSLRGVLRHGRRWLPALLPSGPHGAEDAASQAAAITRTENAQPCLGIVEAAATLLWRQLGLTPAAAAGHSYGELPALASAGCFDTVTLLSLSEARAAAMVEAAANLGDDRGAMAAVALGAEELRRRITGSADVVIANENSPRQSVISGPTPAIEVAVEGLRAGGIGVRRLPVNCAFHSPIVAGAAARLSARLGSVAVRPPRFPVVSGATVEQFPDDSEKVKVLLAEAVAAPVRFVEQVEALYDDGIRVFLEVGPGRALTQCAGAVLGQRPHTAIATDAPGMHGVTALLTACARLMTAGVDVNVEPLFAGRTRPVNLARFPLPAPGWTVDGHLLRGSDGRVVAGALQPANEAPPVSLGASVGQIPVGGGDAREQAVADYLAAMREAVAAQRDVMLRFLGTPVAPAEMGQAPPPRPATSPEPPPPAEASAEPVTPPRAQATDLMGVLVAVVSERTGYPASMLDPQADLEADLSIDSIKRLEILTELLDRSGLSGAGGSATSSGSSDAIIEQVARIKSLRGIVDWLDANATSAPVAQQQPVRPPAAAESAREPDRDDSARLFIRAIRDVGVGLPERRLDLRGRRVVLLMRTGAALADELARALTAEGANVATTQWSAGTQSLDQGLEDALRAADVVVGLDAAEPGCASDARASFPAWRAALAGVAHRLVAVSVDGGFAGGEESSARRRPTGLAGLLRVAALERPGVSVRHVDLPSSLVLGDPARAARLLVDEIADDAGPADVSWREGHRTTRRPTEGAGVGTGDAACTPVTGGAALGPDSVVVLTGGGRGVTAAVGRALQERFGCRLELVGRTVLDPDPRDPGARLDDDRLDDDRYAEAADLPALRRRLAAKGSADLAGVDAQARAIHARREVRATLRALEAVGADVRYHALDVRDAPALSRLVDDVYGRRGRIDAVIHGAGVIDDRLIADKSPASFDKVYATKVDSAAALIAALRPGPATVLLFGSVSGVFGNRGQSDYAAANDALDSLARRLDGIDERRVISVDWGPWQGAGMVTPELEREYARRGIGLIPLRVGVELVVGLLADPSCWGPQLVVAAGDPEAGRTVGEVPIG